MKQLYKEMQERLKYLETLEQTKENLTRINEISLAIVRVQQLLLAEIKWIIVFVLKINLVTLSWVTNINMRYTRF